MYKLQLLFSPLREAAVWCPRAPGSAWPAIWPNYLVSRSFKQLMKGEAPLACKYQQEVCSLSTPSFKVGHSLGRVRDEKLTPGVGGGEVCRDGKLKIGKLSLKKGRIQTAEASFQISPAFPTAVAFSLDYRPGADPEKRPTTPFPHRVLSPRCRFPSHLDSHNQSL